MATANLITLTDPRSPVAEAFRTLRTNLILSTTNKPLHTLLLTSAAESDQKSEVLANLAVTFAQAGHNTILVDSDLRRPVQHQLWGVENGRGLTNMIAEPAAMSNPPLVDTGVENLSLLPSGTLSEIAADVLSSPRIHEVIGVLKARADYVLFDSPPILTVTDATLLSTKVDGVLLIVRTGHTRRDHVTRARLELERVHAPLLGSVLTNAPRERVRY